MSKRESLRLETERLILRPYEKSDGPRISVLLRSREVTWYTYMPHPYTIRDYYGFLRKISTPAARRSNVVVAMVDRETNDVIGAVGIHNLSEKNRSAEIGYWLAKKYWGKGYTVEAVGRVVEYLFVKRRLNRVFAGVFHPNTSSARVLEKSGFAFEGRARKAILHHGRWMDLLSFGLLAQDWRRNKATRRKKTTGSKNRKTK